MISLNNFHNAMFYNILNAFNLSWNGQEIWDSIISNIALFLVRKYYLKIKNIP